MNRIILIGNGFDLAHGLETSYSEVLRNFLKEEYSFFSSQKFKFLESISNSTLFNIVQTKELWNEYKNKSLPKNRYKIQMGNTTEFVDEMIYDGGSHEVVWENLYEYNFNRDVKFKNNFLSNLLYKIKLEKWIDIEVFYFEKLLETKTETAAIKLNEDFKQITDCLEEYLYREYNNNHPKKIQEMQSIFDAICNEQTLLVNFNYTATETLYDLKNSKIIHIHGELKNNNNPIIFGYGDTTSENYKEIKSKNNIECLKNIKLKRYNETNNRKKLKEFIELQPYEIFIMGHSCGISDRDLLRTILEHKNCSLITPYYHQEKEGNKNNKEELSSNILLNFQNEEHFSDKVESQNNWKPLPQAND
jgi:hypothetical protein